MKNIAIQLTDVSKQYTIHHEKPTLVEKFYKSVKGQRDEKFWALKHVNLVVNKGDIIGIMGPNGSGKTTLLKIITGLTSPSSGIVQTKGRIVSLIDLHSGFNTDLTGEQNIYLMGILLGMSKQQIDVVIDKIITFADIKQFIDIPLYTYSLGMIFRLGFSISIYANADILLIDEHILVGDISFQKKVHKKILDLTNQKKTIILVSHIRKLINQYTNHIVYMDKGSIIKNYIVKNTR
jgi:teichoic acid transport system ATP-binding protein